MTEIKNSIVRRTHLDRNHNIKKSILVGRPEASGLDISMTTIINIGSAVGLRKSLHSKVAD